MDGLFSRLAEGMGKAEISITSRSLEDIEAIVTEFAFGPSTGPNVVQSFRKLFGGYSASNYLVNSADSEVAVLKIMNGYGKEWVEGQTALQDRLRVAGFHGVCHCLPLRTGALCCIALTACVCAFRMRILTPRTTLFALVALSAPKEFVTMTGGTPACLLTFCEGSNAATLLEEGKVEANRVLDGVGRGLAALHSVKIDDTECGPPPKLRTWREGGACLVVNHFRGEVLAKMQACEHTAEHDYVVNFYPPRSADLQRLMSEASGLLPHGCLHGDPFLDNVLCLPSGDFSAFVDLEDISTGPLLFDVACCAIGSCFDEKSNALDLNRLQALLEVPLYWWLCV